MNTDLSRGIRIHSIDIMRGLTLFLMLFVNDLYTPGVPKWLVHTAQDEDGMGLADWVFPGFLFIVGLSIPFAFMAREKLGESVIQLLSHILIRTLSLLAIGIFMVNIEDYNADLTGMNKYLWAILVYVSILLVWNRYPRDGQFVLIGKFLKYVGMIGLLIMAVVYRSGTVEDIGWLSTSWWGILGLIGWGYLVSALTYLLMKDRPGALAAVWIGFVILNILGQSSDINFLDPLRPVFGVIIDGNVPSIVLAGLLIGVFLKKYRYSNEYFIQIAIFIGLTCVSFGFILRNWFIISKISGTPSWTMLCSGISILVFTSLYYILDVKRWQRWSGLFLPAGQNSLTTYLAPDILYYSIWGLGLNVLFYKQSEMPWLAVIGSIVWAFAMIGFSGLLSRMNIRIKL